MATTATTSTLGGLDVQTLVSQLMTIERRPIDSLNAKITSAQTKLSALGTIQGLVSNFQSALQTLNQSFNKFSATAADTSVVTAAASGTAAEGSYSINVTTLAQAQKLAAAGQTSDTGAITASASTLTFSVGGVSTDITIGAGATLQDIRSAINAAHIGVTASIINDGSSSPFRLSLSADKTGVDNAVNSITIKTGGDAALNDMLAYNPTENAPAPAIPLTQTVAAQNAVFKINEIQIVKSSNTVTDALPGVTLNLNKGAATTSLTVVRDTNAITSAVSGMIDAYNGLVNQLKSRSAYGSATSQGGTLAGDGTLRSMLDQLRGLLAGATSGGTMTSLSQVGITTQKDGTLKFDSALLGSAMTNNFSDVTNLFSSSTGFSTRLEAWAKGALATDGVLDTRTKTLNSAVSSYNDQVSKLEVRMKTLKTQYTTTYTNLNMMLIKMNDTSSYLTRQLG